MTLENKFNELLDFLEGNWNLLSDKEKLEIQTQLEYLDLCINERLLNM